MIYNLTLEASYPTAYASSPLLYLLLMSMSNQKHTPDTKDYIKDYYDYVIVGGGVAGSVLASRLSEKECVSVLLLEAGKAPPKVTDIPAAVRAFVQTDVDWNYSTAPQEFAADGHTDRRVAWPSGKAIGGSSVINAMLYVRGNRKDFDDWAAQGAKGWSYDEVLPYFMKTENNVNPEYVANGYHGVQGPVTVSRPEYHPELQTAVFKAARKLGYDVVDSNGPRQIGFYDLQATIRQGQRCSAAKAYLVPVDKRPNLDIVANAFVRKIIIEDGVAEGVEFDFKGETRKVRAKEVLLSAGTINSAQLLMLSGVGPKEELEKHGIPLVADLPVGKNLQDHWIGILNFDLNEHIKPFPEKQSDNSSIWRYICTKTGPLTSVQGVTNIAFLGKNGPHSPNDYPDYQLYFWEGTAEGAVATEFRFKPEYMKAMYGNHKNKPFYSCLTQILHPKGRGKVTLQSADPYDPPIIDPMYYSNSEDLDDVVAGMKKCIEISSTDELRAIGSKPFRENALGCGNPADNRDDFLRCIARSFVITLSHQVGTAKMGNPADLTTVVDPKLRVKSVRNLRVVDASVMPMVPSGNTMVPTMMIAEKASDLIKETIFCKGDSVKKRVFAFPARQFTIPYFWAYLK